MSADQRHRQDSRIRHTVATDPRVRRRPDLVTAGTGVALLTALVLWIQVSTAISGGRSGPASLLVAAAGVTFALARLITRRCRWAVPAVVTACAAGLLLLPDAIHERFLGYANAACAFQVLGAAAALMLAARQRHVAVRAVAFLMAAGSAAAVVASDCRAAAVGMALVGLAWLGQRRVGNGRTAILGGVSLVVLALVISTTMGALSLGARGTSSRETRLVDATFSAVRVELWHDALAMVHAKPLTGVGPGRFAELSPTARLDDDWRWAHHELLQLAAETGLVGLALGIAVAAWVFARLWCSRHDVGAVIAAAAIAALLTNATVDYVLHFPAVTLAAAALAAAGVSQTRRSALSS
ncbi:MAG: O-antigen ligase family protein [Egibacteraceae bacterium]